MVKYTFSSDLFYLFQFLNVVHFTTQHRLSCSSRKIYKPNKYTIVATLHPYTCTGLCIILEIYPVTLVY